MLTTILESIGLPSPALALGVLMAIAAASGWSYHLGHTNGYNESRAEVATAHEKSIEIINSQLEAASQRALAAEAKARATADREATATTKLTNLLEDLRHEKPIPATCFSDSFRVRLSATVRAINSYDSATDNPSGVSPEVPVAAGIKR